MKIKKIIHILVFVGIILCASMTAKNVGAATVDIGDSKAFNRNVLGQPLYFAMETPELLNRTASRSASVGSWVHKFNWKDGDRAGSGDDVIKIIDYLISDRDNNSESFFQVNMRGITDGSGAYIDETAATMSNLAADLVRYTNFILPNYRQGDVLDASDQNILDGITWSAKLLLAGSPSTHPVKYWIIGNEEDLTSYWTPQALAERYKIITSAMKSVDPSIKVGICVTYDCPVENRNMIRTLFQDQTAEIDAVYYHSYPNIGNFYQPDTESPDYADMLANMQQQLRNTYDREKARRDYYADMLIADGRDIDNIDIIHAEWNMMGWVHTQTYQTMVMALATAEAVFTYADIDMPASMFWADTRHRYDGTKTMWPVGLFYKAMIEYVGDRFVDRYISATNDNVRLYTTKCSVTGRVALWALNFDNTSGDTINISLNNISPVGAKTLMRLGAIDEAETSLFLGNTVGSGLTGELPVDWRVADVTNDANYANLQNFNLYVPQASILVLILEPAIGSSDICGDVNSVYLSVDLNRDCTVDLLDFALIARSWLYCTDPDDINCNMYLE